VDTVNRSVVMFLHRTRDPGIATAKSISTVLQFFRDVFGWLRGCEECGFPGAVMEIIVREEAGGMRPGLSFCKTGPSCRSFAISAAARAGMCGHEPTSDS
jgi:predicted enzyme related to lactoylglutathione lyase